MDARPESELVNKNKKNEFQGLVV